ncbi:methyltransferase type 11 [Sporosarcina sp. NCCP-2716]|uniref:class I SAM-dependent methyltransferase n=1 Tax=Sporosarcina sp. NCCP-2716 TaxID=2943679 RepID=UPI00203C4DC6|nr:class I SAM-dependent methyltransferase [Sporosarcina sp. NCCP-2716]GKV68654.1 methyltransferase type 11 [Sporosarcina sp. NCCP-2716]
MIPIVYDQVNRWARDDEFFLDLLRKVNPDQIADLGCGTGRLTTHFSKAGYTITAIDPNEEALEYAKKKTYANDVTWIVGDSRQLEASAYDAVVMTANVAQVFLTDESWRQVVSDVYRSLNPGGHFIFDTRNPLAKAWEQWEKDLTPDVANDMTTGDPLEIWTDYEGFEGDVFTFYETVKTVHTGETLIRERMQLRFRTLEEIRESLQMSGFSSIEIYSDWQFEPATAKSQSFIFHAVK